MVILTVRYYYTVYCLLHHDSVWTSQYIIFHRTKWGKNGGRDTPTGDDTPSSSSCEKAAIINRMTINLIVKGWEARGQTPWREGFSVTKTETHLHTLVLPWWYSKILLLYCLSLHHCLSFSSYGPHSDIQLSDLRRAKSQHMIMADVRDVQH